MIKLTDAGTIKRLQKAYGFRMKKRFGQNFLLDEHVILDTLDGAEIGPEDLVVEIGPGFGTLTRALAGRARRVLAVEIDTKAVEVLGETLKDLDNVQLIPGDCMKMSLDQLAGEPYKVVANLPYYITTPILMKLLEEESLVTSVTVMVQKEVGQRMEAPPGGKDYGALSVAVQYHSSVRRIRLVKPGAFWPPPSVDSAVIRLDILREPPVQVPDKKLFFRVVKAAFAQRRKTLLNTLTAGFPEISRDRLSQLLEACAVDPGRRGETLSLQEFAVLTGALHREMAGEEKYKI